jgi:SNF2 family DNA or RNA helicase
VPEEPGALPDIEEGEGLPERAGVVSLPLEWPIETLGEPRLGQSLEPTVREARLLTQAPWVRGLGTLALKVSSVGWRFPAPFLDASQPLLQEPDRTAAASPAGTKTTRLQPPDDVVVFKDRLLYLLQPPLENLFASKQISLPLAPFNHQLEGIAFLMPRHGALLADEMGLGKTAQVILALRLLFHAGLVHSALVVCPKALVSNWSHELRNWGEDLPQEIIGGDTQARRASWLVSNCPLKLVNYELVTRDAELLADDRVRFDVVVLDEAQRIKNRGSRTAEVVCSIRRKRSWALTGTPIENKPEDLVNIFAFVDPGRVPHDIPARRLPQLTSDSILRRVKEDVLSDMPARIIRDTVLELTPEQRAAYELAETEGVVRLNGLGATITVHHVFELVLRLKQICNFDPATGQSAKLDQLAADMQEVAESGRKAIVFSQWVEPLRAIATALAPFGPLQFHGQVPMRQRQAVLEQFQNDPSRHVILMSYGTGGVGLNLQCANYVFLFDRWWNPAVEDQAINRAHRIGQKSQVIVTRFLTQGTIEGRIAEVLERKRQLFNDLIEQNGPPASLGLSEEEIFGLFDITARPRRPDAKPLAA